MKEIALAGPREAKQEGREAAKPRCKVTSKNLDKYLGVRNGSISVAPERKSEVGLVTGLAWTEVGWRSAADRGVR